MDKSQKNSCSFFGLSFPAILLVLPALFPLLSFIFDQGTHSLTHSPTDPPTALCQPQLPVERLRARLPPQKVLERLHLVFAAAPLEDRVAVAPALRGVHRVGGKDGMKHVGRVDLGAVFVLVLVKGHKKITQEGRVEEWKGKGRAYDR